MRIVLTPRYDEIEDEQPYECPGVYRFAFQFMEGSGNIHIIKTDIIEQIFENVNGDVIVWYEDNTKDTVENYTITSIEEL